MNYHNVIEVIERQHLVRNILRMMSVWLLHFCCAHACAVRLDWQRAGTNLEVRGFLSHARKQVEKQIYSKTAVIHQHPRITRVSIPLVLVIENALSPCLTLWGAVLLFWRTYSVNILGLRFRQQAYDADNLPAVTLA